MTVPGPEMEEVAAVLHHAGNHVLIADPLLESQPKLDWFRPEAWKAQGRLVGQAQSGRGATFFVQAQPSVWALRHYRRGGWVARIVSDRYLWLGLPATRAWREWRLTAWLHDRGLPVPRPVAAHVERLGWTYRADLITERIEGVRQLTHWLAEQPLPAAEWRAIGVMLRRFHDAGLYHHDLNCDNILRRADGSLFLLDFDRCRLRAAGRWQRANLKRLLRSLNKRQRKGRLQYFSTSDWAALKRGYRSGEERRDPAGSGVA